MAIMIGALWRGEVGLAKAYWLYGVAGLSACNLCLSGLFAGAVQRQLSLPYALALLGIALSASGYAFLVSVGIWRSASKYGGLFVWPWLAKAAVAGGLVSAGIVLLARLGLLS